MNTPFTPSDLHAFSNRPPSVRCQNKTQDLRLIPPRMEESTMTSPWGEAVQNHLELLQESVVLPPWWSLLYFFRVSFLFRAHCWKKYLSSETSGREVGRTMGGRMICIFWDAHMAVRRTILKWCPCFWGSPQRRYTWAFTSTCRVNKQPEVQIWITLLQKCATAAVEESALCNQVEFCCIIDPNTINVNEGSTLMLMEWWSWWGSKSPELIAKAANGLAGRRSGQVVWPEWVNLNR